MINDKKIIIFPGAFQFVKNYGDYEGVDIWLKNKSEQYIPDADYCIAHSLGANFIFARSNIKKKKIILINPLIKKRNVFNLFLRWIAFYFSEGIEKKKIVPINNWIFALRRIFRLRKVDILDAVIKIPKRDVAIIRGKKDCFFCDRKSVKIIKKNDLTLIEVEAGHDWNEKIAEAVDNILENK